MLIFKYNFVFGQNEEYKPKVALVLSGGTAKGLAHIGVIQYMEEMGIRPDIIIGTSMGAIVGGLYAIGYTAEDLKKIAENTNWFLYLSNDTDLRNLNIEEKDDFEDFLYVFPIEKGKPELNKGLVYGHEIELNLARITFPAVEYSNFDSFPIKFRAIATDVIEGKEFIFKEGSLSTAMRASMSMPALFYPVKYRDKLLIDGGITDNFGIEVAVKEGADIIIGSNVGNYLYDENELGTFQKISSQIIMFNSKKKMARYNNYLDILIEPPVSSMGTRFDKADLIIDEGYLESTKHKTEFEELKNCIDYYSKNKKKYHRPVLHMSVQIDSILISGISNYSVKQNILKKIRKNINSNIGPGKIEKEISALYGSGQYSKISYNIKKNNLGKFNLDMNFTEAPGNKLQVGLNYNNQSNMGVILGFTARNSFLPFSKFKVLGRISNYPGIDQYYAKYINKNVRQGFKENFSYFFDRVPVYIDNQKKNELNRHFIIGSISQMIIPTKNTLFELGYQYQFKQLKRNYLSNDINYQYTINQTNSIFFYFYFNNLNDKFFPNEGNFIKTKIYYNFYNKIKQKLDADYFYKNQPLPYPKITFQWKNYKNINKNLTWSNELYLEYLYADFEDENLFYDNTLGGAVSDNSRQIEFWGLPNNYLSSANYLVLRTGLSYNIFNKAFVTGILNAGLANEYKEYFGAGISIDIDSPLGPLKVGISSSLEYKYPVFHFSLGYFH